MLTQDVAAEGIRGRKAGWVSAADRLMDAHDCRRAIASAGPRSERARLALGPDVAGDGKPRIGPQHPEQAAGKLAHVAVVECDVAVTPP